MAGFSGVGPRGPCPPKLLVNFPINLRCYVLLGCRVKNVILACLKKSILMSAFFDTAALVRQSGGLRWLHCHMTTAYSSGYTAPPPPPSLIPPPPSSPPPHKPKSWLRHWRASVNTRIVARFIPVYHKSINKP